MSFINIGKNAMATNNTGITDVSDLNLAQCVQINDILFRWFRSKPKPGSETRLVLWYLY